MTSILTALQWVITNWSLIATCFSTAASIALFFMHGAAQADLKELKDFVNSLQISQAPIDANAAKTEEVLKNPKV